MTRGISIHIGLNQVDPNQYGGWDGQLQACEYDARDMAVLAEQNGFGDRTLLLTQDATVANAMSAIGSAVEALEPGGMLFLTYSGHGGQVPDTNGDESDDYQDETWLLYDRQFIDDELYWLYGQFREGVRILVLSDSCHSGTVHREIPTILQPAVLEARYGGSDAESVARRTRAMPQEVQLADYRSRKSIYDAVQVQVPAKAQSEIWASLILISGCADNQLSGDGARNGVFTARLLDIWNQGKFEGSYRGFHQAIVAGMPPDQTPNLATAGLGTDSFLTLAPFAI
jgi:metacaspase-1